MGEDEVKGTMMYYDENLGEWKMISSVCEMPEIEYEPSVNYADDIQYFPQTSLYEELTGTIEYEYPETVSNLKDRGPLRRAYFKLCVAWFSGDRRKIKRAKRNFKKAKERYLKEIKND